METYPLLKVDGLSDCLHGRRYDATHAIEFGLPVALVMYLHIQLIAAVAL